jgi:hypothetical protein
MLMCAVFAVVFGRGPVPWIHTHETLARHGHSEAALAWHIEHFHQMGDEDHGWHIHWTLPWNIVNCPCQHDNTPTEEKTSVLEMPFDVVQSTSIDHAVADAHAGAPPPMLFAVDRNGHSRWGPVAFAGFNFLETYSPGVTLRALLCVARC